MADKGGCSNFSCGLTRREFVCTCAGCAAGLSAFSALNVFAAGVAQPKLPSGDKAKIKLVFTHISPDTPTWPNIGYDYEGRKKELLKKAEKIE